MKLFLRILFLALIAVIILLFLSPFLFKGQIQDAIKAELNKQLHAEIDFSDVGLSLIKDFPNIAIDVEDFSIKGTDNWEGQELLRAESIYLRTNLKSIIKPQDGIEILSFILQEPVLNIVVNEDGKANYDIGKETDSENEKSFFGDIDSYTIKDGIINYTDKSADVHLSMKDLDHSGKGQFRNIIFDLDTETKVDEMDLKMDGIPYLNNANLSGDIMLGIDMENKKYTFKENLIKINDLDLAFTGDMVMKDPGFGLDLEIEAPNNKVSSILSIIPSSFTSDFADVRSEGNSFLKGIIRGDYNAEKGIYPTVDLQIDIDNGSIKYPDLGLPIEDIDLDIRILGKAADLSDLNVDIKSFRFLIDQNTMLGKMNIRQVMSNPHITGNIDGNLDLADLANAYPLEGTDLKSGKIKANVEIDASAQDVSNQAYSKMKLNGDITATDLDVNYGAYPIKIEQADMDLSPQSISSTIRNMTVGDTDVNGEVNVGNPLAFITEDGVSETKINARSKRLNLDQLKSYADQGKGDVAVDTTTADLNFFKSLNIQTDYQAQDIVYEDYKIKDLEVNGQYADDGLTIRSTSVQLDGSKMAMRGNLENVSAYALNNKTLTGKLFLDAEDINADKYMSEPGESEEITEPVIVPTNLNLDIYPEIKTLKYDAYTLQDVEGKVTIRDGRAELTEGLAKAMDGQINLDGLYDSTDPKNPLYDLRLNLNNLNFSKVFQNSKSFKVMAPIAQYINGLFNSTLVMAGPLGMDMSPDLNKMTASGFLETLKGQVNGFEPLQKLGNAIGIEKLSRMTIDGSKNWFDIENGKVVLKPHDHQVDDMTFRVGGTHSINQELDYKINAIIPREKLSKDKLGKNLEYGMDFLEKEANSRGVNIDLGDMIYLDIFVTGTIKNPKLKVLPVGSGGKTLQEVVKGEVVKQVDILKDTITTELEKKTEEIKDTVSTVIKTKLDEQTDKAKEKAKTALEKQKDAIKDKLKDKLDTTVTKVITDDVQKKVEDKAKDILGGQATGEIDSLKSKLKDWNPFKKKNN